MVTLQLVSATPFTTKYLMTSDGQGGSASILVDQLIADANTAGPGPSELGPFFAKQTNDSWPFVPQDPSFSVYVTNTDNNGNGFVPGVKFELGDNAPNMVVVTSPASVIALIEMRFHNSLVG